jgi:hypothetical protein
MIADDWNKYIENMKIVVDKLYTFNVLNEEDESGNWL